MANPVITRFKAVTSQHDQQIRKSKKEIKEYGDMCSKIKGSISEFGSSFKGSMTSMIGFTSAAGAAVTAASALKDAIANNIETAKTFEKSISGLSALTGMVGEDLEKLKGYAIELGGSTTQSASQVAEAFMLIGSQKPELLKSADALKDVTAAAITLGEAAGIDVTQAATALTASLNIMGEGADQANRYINVLAAGSKEGSVDINGLTDIVYKAGQAASLNKMTFEELIAVAETIGPSFGSAAEAGTALNAMLLKLETQTNDKYKPSVVGLYEALSNLENAHISAADATKLVTETGYKALVPLLQNIDATKQLQENITGTTTAEDQARTNTDNLDGDLKNLGSAWEKLNLTINDGNELLRHTVQRLTDLVNGIKDAIDWCSELKSEWDDAMSSMSTSLYNLLKDAGFNDLASLWSEFDNRMSGGSEGPTHEIQPDEEMPSEVQVYRAKDNTLYATEAEAKKHNEELKKRKSSSSSSNKKKTKKTSKKTPKKTKPDVYASDSVRAQEKKVEKLEDLWRRAPASEADAAYTAWQDAKTVLDTMEKTTKPKKAEKPKVTVTSSLTELQQLELELSNVQESMKGWEGTEDWEDMNKYAESLKKQIEAINGSPLKLVTTESLSELQQLQSELSNVQASLSTANSPEEYKSMSDYIVKLQKQIKKITGEDAVDRWNNVANAASSFGQALQNLGDKGTIGVVGLVASAIGQLIAQFAAIPKGATVWDWIAGSMAGVATLTSVVSQIKSLSSGSYATGGIIPGNNHNDGLVANVSSGELILNRAQQGNIASQLQGSGFGQMQLSATIKGEDIRLALNNNSRRRGKGEYVTSRA